VGHAVVLLDQLEGTFLRRARERLGVTAFGVNVMVLPSGTEWFEHTHERQDELYFVHAGRAGLRVDTETLEVGPGGLVHVEAATPRQIWNAGDEDLIVLMVGGKDGYVGRDGQLVHHDRDFERRKAAGEGDLDAIRRSSR
jgi:mannose-6-phosphate isomerase-like protein (cupin superfamily)